MANLTDAYKLAHCKGELGRGKVERCPRGWLIAARRYAKATGDFDAAEACAIALCILRGELSHTDANVRPMRKLAGRRLS